MPESRAERQARRQHPDRRAGARLKSIRNCRGPVAPAPARRPHSGTRWHAVASCSGRVASPACPGRTAGPPLGSPSLPKPALPFHPRRPSITYATHLVYPPSRSRPTYLPHHQFRGRHRACERGRSGQMTTRGEERRRRLNERRDPSSPSPSLFLFLACMQLGRRRQGLTERVTGRSLEP